jgi:magnesium-transporting ATPase (P-type)
VPPELSDHDMLIRIDEALQGKGGVIDRVEAVKGIATEARDEAQRAAGTAEVAVERARSNERRINRLSGANAVFAAAAGAVAGAVGWLKGA